MEKGLVRRCAPGLSPLPLPLGAAFLRHARVSGGRGRARPAGTWGDAMLLSTVAGFG